MTDHPLTPEEEDLMHDLECWWADISVMLRADGVDPDAVLDRINANMRPLITEGGGLPPPHQEARDEQASDETTPLPAAQARAAADPDDEPL